MSHNIQMACKLRVLDGRTWKIILLSSVFALLLSVGGINCMEKMIESVWQKEENRSEGLSSVKKKLMEIQSAYEYAKITKNELFKEANKLQSKKNKIRAIQVILGMAILASIRKDFVEFKPALIFLPLGIMMVLLDSYRPLEGRLEYLVNGFWQMFTNKWILDFSLISGFIAMSVKVHKVEKQRYFEEQKAINSAELVKALNICDVKFQDISSESKDKFTKEDHDNLRDLYLHYVKFKK
ncbi:MAG: hypothetical protein ACD_82C00156G0002 [uncultured bacterium]|jgi:hypothetical protein|nr:MAG: hypothetical protein ACD_82C00156G0002 [uncultured bacterium]KKP29652.1 MAG: hypothetical protein UR12_C0004G0023 [candidate division TM6 bacterium GW2011_GWF2_30_66]